MKTLKPELFSVMKTYSKEQCVKDIIAGIIVAIIALPLSIALALASGVSPEQGLYTAIVAGFIISFCGGSRVQIAGPTAAFASTVAVIVAKNGMNGLIITTLLAGIILILMGLLRMGSLIRFIPYTITTGFTAGIAITIVVGQLKDFLGLTFSSPIETVEKVEAVVSNIHNVNSMALAIGILSLAILILWPKVNEKIPASLIAIVVAAGLVKIADLKVNTIGDLYTISSSLPRISMPTLDVQTIWTVLPDAFTIAVLAAIESLLCCVVSDGMIGSKHNSNMELVAQGIGNTFSALFGGIPATGAIARTAANVKNGGRTPVAGMVHGIVLLLILVFFMPYASLIPMPTIAAILFVVAYNMSEWRQFVSIIKTSPKSDITVLVLTFVLTVVFDLVVAIGVGLVVAAVLFMKRMADVSEVSGWVYIDNPQEKKEEMPDSNCIGHKMVPENTLVYEVTGPMFFGAAENFTNIIVDAKKEVVIVRMSNVPAMDASGLRCLEKLHQACMKHGIVLVLSHVKEQPLSVLKKSGLDCKIGKENLCPNIDAALTRAEEIGEETVSA